MKKQGIYAKCQNRECQFFSFLSHIKLNPKLISDSGSQNVYFKTLKKQQKKTSQRVQDKLTQNTLYRPGV